MEGVLLQALNLKIGEKAKCRAGYPYKWTVVIECIKDFPELENSDDVVNNPYNYIKVKDGSLLTSHVISSNWSKLDSYGG